MYGMPEMTDTEILDWLSNPENRGRENQFHYGSRTLRDAVRICVGVDNFKKQYRKDRIRKQDYCLCGGVGCNTCEHQGRG